MQYHSTTSLWCSCLNLLLIVKLYRYISVFTDKLLHRELHVIHPLLEQSDMEDAHTHILGLADEEDSAFFAVYDGHGGK